MELLEYQPWLLFILAGFSLITAIITGGRFFYNRYISGLNKRIDDRIKSEIAKSVKRISKLERKIALIIEIAVPARKRKLIQATELDNDE